MRFVISYSTPHTLFDHCFTSYLIGHYVESSPIAIVSRCILCTVVVAALHLLQPASRFYDEVSFHFVPLLFISLLLQPQQQFLFFFFTLLLLCFYKKNFLVLFCSVQAMVSFNFFSLYFMVSCERVKTSRNRTSSNSCDANVDESSCGNME